MLAPKTRAALLQALQILKAAEASGEEMGETGALIGAAIEHVGYALDELKEFEAIA
jgi:hypothetical protein